MTTGFGNVVVNFGYEELEEKQIWNRSRRLKDSCVMITKFKLLNMSIIL